MRQVLFTGLRLGLIALAVGLPLALGAAGVLRHQIAGRQSVRSDILRRRGGRRPGGPGRRLLAAGPPRREDRSDGGATLRIGENDGNDMARLSIRTAYAGADARLHGGGRAHPGSGHRCEHRRVQRGQCGGAQTPALPGFGSPCHPLGTDEMGIQTSRRTGISSRGIDRARSSRTSRGMPGSVSTLSGSISRVRSGPIRCRRTSCLCWVSNPCWAERSGRRKNSRETTASWS